MSIKNLIRSGLALLVLSLITWLVVWRWAKHPIYTPLTTSFPTAENARIDESFPVNTPERYGIHLVCRRSGPPDDKPKEIPCNISLTISNRGIVTSEKTIEALSLGFSSQDELGYRLLYVDLYDQGTYSLSILNRGDLSSLDSSEPKLEVKMSVAAVESRFILEAIVTYLCMGLGSIGLILLVSGLILKGRGTNRSELERK